MSKGAYRFHSFGAWFVAFGTAVFSGVAALLWAQHAIHLDPDYQDFFAGAITWEATGKIQDFLSYPFFILAFLLGGGAMVLLFNKVNAGFSEDYETTLVTALLWWCIPFAIVVGGAVGAGVRADQFSIYIGLIGIFLVTAGTLIGLRRGGVSPEVLGVGVLAAMLIGLTPFALGTIQDRLHVFGNGVRLGAAPSIGTLLFLVVASHVLFLCWRYPRDLAQRLRNHVFVAQLGITPFYLLLLPDIYIGDSWQPGLGTTIWLRFLVFGLILAAVADVLRRNYRGPQRGDVAIAQRISPLAIFATLILFRTGQTAIPQISPDDYHFGESLLGWWTFWEFGKVPYVDYFPPHGILGDDLGGYLSLIFYDGTAASIPDADRLAAALLMLTAYLALSRYTGRLGLAYVSVLLFGLISRKLYFLVLVPFVCLWFKTDIKTHPTRFLSLWILSAAFLILAVPAQGLLLTIASAPIVFLQMRAANDLSGWRTFLVIALVALAVAFLTPLPKMLYGSIRYVFENAAVNASAYGIPWNWSWRVAQDKTQTILAFSLDIFRMSWIAVAALAATLVAFTYRQPAYWKYMARVALPVFIFISLMVPYSMGRIDPGAPSRAGLLSNFSWAVLLPILLTPFLSGNRAAWLALAVGFACSGFGLASVNRGALNDVLVTNRIERVWSGDDHHLSNVGRGSIDPLHAERLLRINAFLASHLKPREPYLDLTGRNAHYMYFDRPPPVHTTAPYNLPSIRQQQRAVKQLVAAPPRIALLEAANQNQDGGGLAIRTHLLYRFVLQHYVAELHDGFVYGLANGLNLTSGPVSFFLRDITDANWTKGVHRTEAALVIRDAVAIRFMSAGDQLKLPNGEVRRITRVWNEGNAVWLDGPALNPDIFHQQKGADLLVVADRRMQISTQLLSQVFSVADLRALPVAWGRSVESLSSVMRKVMDIDLSAPAHHDLEKVGEGWKVVGQDPYLWVDLSGERLAGVEAGILKFRFQCLGQPTARLQIFWWGDDMAGPDPARSFTFTAQNGTVIVPLDSYPAWLLLGQVKGLRIDLDSVANCRSVAIGDVSLSQRTNLVDLGKS